MFTDGLNMDFLVWARVEKTVHGVKTHWLLSKEKVQAQWTVKKIKSSEI